MPLQKLKDHLALIDRAIEIIDDEEFLKTLQDAKDKVLNFMSAIIIIGTLDDINLNPIIESIDGLFDEFMRYLCLFFDKSKDEVLDILYK